MGPVRAFPPSSITSLTIGPASRCATSAKRFPGRRSHGIRVLGRRPRREHRCFARADREYCPPGSRRAAERATSWGSPTALAEREAEIGKWSVARGRPTPIPRSHTRFDRYAALDRTRSGRSSTVTAGGSTARTGKPRAIHAARPPSSGRTRVMPLGSGRRSSREIAGCQRGSCVLRSPVPIETENHGPEIPRPRRLGVSAASSATRRPP
jgi:hypothetical protein